MRRKAMLLTAICVLAVAGMVLSYSGGPPDRRTGAPGESNCSSCHQNLNVPGGSIWLTGPSRYNPGDTLSLILNLSRNSQQAWGFELTVLDTSHSPIGTLIRTDTARTQLSHNANGRSYLKQTLAGTDLGVQNAAPGWQFLWVAPEQASGPATLYACGNAADGSGDPQGDHCYTLASVISEAGCCHGTTGNVNLSGIVDLSDLSLLISYLTDGAILLCPEAANVDAKGIVDLSDLSLLTSYITNGGFTLPACPEN